MEELYRFVRRCGVLRATLQVLIPVYVLNLEYKLNGLNNSSPHPKNFLKLT